MLIYRRTSLLESSAQTLVNTVNCVGVMGKGLAQAFKEREPQMFAAYKRICGQHLLEPGKLWLWRGSSSWVLNFPTKQHWRNSSKLEWIEAGLAKFVLAYKSQGITEISFPKLGCGNGNLDWDEVRPVMEAYLGRLPIKVYIHDFTKDIGLPEHLEAIADALRRSAVPEPSFEGFLRALHQVVDLGGDRLVELGSEAPFRAAMNEPDVLTIETADTRWQFEEEALRGVWLELQSGVVTQDRAGWTARDAGAQLVTMLSMLPGIRPIEIQRKDASDPELAVERVTTWHELSPVALPPSQTAFAWH
ncbi:macro domain-containing protein [Gluconacetobacter aggeris]|uniref:Macro domain-containing protein n=1 Tax=Gluconacetobacter aggeris TaxID=1286186 RepID=A0A7W4IQ62_9PROT|nr:macro domain-containing protein [Gluconacetobacter aggeris]MBB2166923.1 macro domain-containing protein [Gluconacetobacter aggeris]